MEITPEELLERIRAGQDVNYDQIIENTPALKGFRTKLAGWAMSAPPGLIALVYWALGFTDIDPQIVIDAIAEVWRMIVAVYAAGGYLVQRYRDEA